MNIQNITKTYASQLYEVKKQSPSDHKGTVHGNTAQSEMNEKVELSDTNALIHSVKNHIDSLPEVRIAIVQKIKAQIKMNDYPLENNLDISIERLLHSKIVHQ